MVRAFLAVASCMYALADPGAGVARIAGDEKGFLSRYAADASPKQLPTASTASIAKAAEPASTASIAKADEVVLGAKAVEVVSTPAESAAVAYDATQCKTLQELDAWRLKVLDHIHTFVPKPYQEFASNSIEKKYQERRAQLMAGSSDVKPVADGVPAKVQLLAETHPSPEVSGGAQSSSEQPGAQPSNTSPDLRHMLRDVLNCNTRDELEAWRLKVRDFIGRELPQEYRQFALADMQRHYEIRSADILRVSAAPDAEILAQMLADVDQCASEPELMIWREHVASHIRSKIPPRFQIPALSDMQMRFDRRLDVLHKAASNPEMDASAVPEPRHEDTVSSAAGFGTFALVLGGLTLPACMAVLVAFLRGRQRALVPSVCDVETYEHLLEA